MPQLWYPIEPGMSARVDYRRSTSGSDMRRVPGAGVVLDQPDAVSLMLRATAAGHVPVIGTACQQDFVRLVQALTRRNEPEVIPASMGACMISGHLNLPSLHDVFAAWIATSHAG
ncbi:MAG: hypothetical protein U5K74_01140 [Gemmatimonadaceae bacterium]|nr:hypothetical protein [Gemmatimonadaceae bacterium]